MKVKTYGTARACALAACALLCAANTATARVRRQQQPPPQEIKLSSEAELKSWKAVQSAADGAAALAAAGEFLKKFPKSPARAEAAVVVADKIATVPDAARRVALAEGFLKTFNEPAEANLINGTLALAYANANRLDDAFRVADPAAVGNFTSPIGALVALTVRGADEASQKANVKYLAQSQQLGLKAVEMFEAATPPAGVDPAKWTAYKAEWLPQVYHSLAVMSYVGGDKDDARAKLERAAALNTTVPVTYYLMGVIADEEYAELANKHKAATGDARTELEKQALAQMDKVVDAFARAVALAEGDARYEQLRAGLRPKLEEYYKFRNKGSADGMQALIDKYKKPAARP